MTDQPNVNPFDIPDEEMIFGSDSDVFNREDFAEKFLKIIHDMPGERVILLDSPWGEGKTVFAKMFKNYLKDKDYYTVYYDVFAHDYYEQPLLPFIAEIYQLIDKGKESEKKIKDVAIAALKDISHAITAGMATNLTDEILKTKSKINLNELKEYLTALPDNMEDKYKNKPIIFIIDELDRCKPTYAIRILEIIKHLFSVPNIVFVLVANSEQLCQSIKHEYGNDIDGYSYLHKFIHLRITLPKQNKNRNINKGTYIEHCMQKLKLSGEDNKNIFIEFSEHYQLSFREIERYLLAIKITFTLLHHERLRDAYRVAIIFLIIVKNKFPDSYIKLSNKNITYEEFIAQMNLEDKLTRDAGRYATLGDLLKLHLNDTNHAITTLDKYSNTRDCINEIIIILNNFSTLD